MTLGFLFGSKNFCKLLCVSWEVFLLHGSERILWVARSCTTTAYQWLFRDSPSSLRTLSYAVIKSPNLSARCTTLPLRLLHGALVILVLRQISQFRSLGKWVKNAVLARYHFCSRLWRYFMRRTGSLSVFWNTFIFRTVPELLWPLWQIMRQVSLHILVVVICIWVFDFGWSMRQVSLYFSTHTLTSCCCWMLRGSHALLRWRCRRSRWR